MSDLESFARQCFSDLAAAEIEMLRAVPKGKTANCSPKPWRPNVYDADNDPSTAEYWGGDRKIRAELIRWICVEPDAKKLVDPSGLQVFGARIVGSINLFSVSVPFPLILQCCSLDDEFNLRCADISGLNLGGTWVRSIAADGIRVKNNIFLRQGFHASGQVRFLTARIDGNLECDGGKFENAAKLNDPSGGMALIADGAIVNGAVFLRSGFSALGEVRLSGAQIGGYLDCTNATFKNAVHEQTEQANRCLNAQSAVVMGSVFLRARFRAEGEVRFAGAQIGGDFDCSDGTFSNSISGVALDADRIAVRGSIFLSNGFCADGEVRLLGGQIGCDLDCDRGQFKTPRHQDGIDHSLSAHSAVVARNVLLRQGFRATGEVAFTGAQIGGSFECTGGAFHGMLSLQSASVKGAWFATEIADRQELLLDLANASVGALADESQAWPESGKQILDGFVYGRFAGTAPKNAKTRLEWLARQRLFASQPYRQLARVLKDEGDEVGAKQVLYEMERLRWAQANASVLASPWNFALRYVTGYGYYPGRALLWLFGLVLLGFVLFDAGFHAGSVVPSDKDAYACFTSSHSLPAHYARFHASIYSLENSFPLVKLGQVDRWLPDPAQRYVPSPYDSRKARLFHRLLSPSFLRWFGWCQILGGWFFATMGIAGVTGLVRRD